MEANRKLMKARLKVIKTDGTCEEYLHTKVMHTINKALACVDQTDIITAENLSEVVTYYLYKRHGEAAIPSNEILSVVKVTLTATGYEAAAEALANHHSQRKLRRGRVELVHVNLEKASDAHKLFGDGYQLEKSPWDKSVIVEDLIAEEGLDRHTARTIASMVEERLFSLELTAVPASLVKQLVLSDTAAVLRAQKQLQTA
jgi:transcriptional regulator NrdR family protein